MLLSVNGTLSIFAAYANLLTIATFLGIGVETTKKYASHPIVKLILLYVFAYSVINDKLACLLAVALFTVVEVREFITDSVANEADATHDVSTHPPDIVAKDAVDATPDVELSDNFE